MTCRTWLSGWLCVSRLSQIIWRFCKQNNYIRGPVKLRVIRWSMVPDSVFICLGILQVTRDIYLLISSFYISELSGFLSTVSWTLKYIADKWLHGQYCAENLLTKHVNQIRLIAVILCSGYRRFGYDTSIITDQPNLYKPWVIRLLSPYQRLYFIIYPV